MVRLLVLLAAGAAGAAIAAWGIPRGGRPARAGVILGMLALLGMTAAAFVLRETPVTDTGQPITGAFDAHLVGSAYLRLVVGLWGLQSLILMFVAAMLGGLPRLGMLLPATLAALTGGTVAMASADLSVGAAAGAVTGLASLLVILAGEGPASVAAGARELRVTLATGTTIIVAMAIVPLAAQLAFISAGIGLQEAAGTASGIAGPALGLVAVAVALALAARWGMPPFHVRLSRLSDLVPTEALPLLIAWTPVPVTVVVFAAIDRLIAPLALPFDGERVLLVALGVLTVTGASVAAAFHDDLRHAVGYLVVADSALLLLALAALDPSVWGAERAWVVVLAASKTALAGWAAVIEDRFDTRSIPDLRGWARRSPLLATALVLVILATYGLPGWVALDARSTLAAGVWGSPWQEILLLVGFLTLPSYLRLAGVGIGRPTTRVDRAAPERIIRHRAPIETLVVEQEVTGGYAIVGGPPATGRAAAVSVARGAVAGARDAVTGAASGARGAAGRARTAAAGAASAMREAVSRDEGESSQGRVRVSARSAARSASPSEDRPSRAATIAAGIGTFVARDRTELLSAAILALAILAALTSWGALDIATAAAEPAPILLGGQAD
jgi:formate hydrogenlyase subunit 3/multisubunit Na+/H+ antiporter MnhD subunit